jgi:hypothetical protein
MSYRNSRPGITGRSVRLALGALCTLSALPAARAGGVSAYLPLNLSPEIERMVERVLVLGDQPVLTRPVPIETVRRALPKACRVDAELCRRVSAYVAQYDSTVAVTDASGELAAATGSKIALPNMHGLASDANWDGSAEAFYRPSPYVLISGGLVAQPHAPTSTVAQAHDLMPTGSEVALGTDALQVDVGYRDRWLSPLTDSSMLDSTQAPTLPSVTLSNPRPLTPLGIEYQAFVARMSYSDRIAWQNGYTAGDPRLAGAHLGIAPVAGWALSGNANWQYGGGARPGSLSELARNLFSRTVLCSSSGEASASATDCRFSNRELSLTSAFDFPGPLPFEAYTEFAGRDTFHGEVYRMHETDLSAGVHFPNIAKRFDLILEASEWQNGWYADYVWLDGMTEDGFVLGNWGAQWRNNPSAGSLAVPGAESLMAQLGWQLPSGDTVNVRYRTLQNQDYYGGDYRRAHMVTLEYSQSNGAFMRGLTLDAGSDVYGVGFARLAAFLRFDGDDEGAYTPYTDENDGNDNTDAATPPATRTERYVEVGVSTGQLGLNRYGFDLPPNTPAVVYTSVTAPHLGIGVRRAVSEHNDFGVRLEYDHFDGTMLGLRALDYRYRFGRHASAGGFFGFARYSAPTPAQGYYAGLEAMWRDVLPRWDLALDWRYFDRLQRDKLLSGEATGSDPVEYYTMKALTLSVVRRF